MEKVELLLIKMSIISTNTNIDSTYDEYTKIRNAITVLILHISKKHLNK
jgi:hypothetical protein